MTQSATQKPPLRKPGGPGSKEGVSVRESPSYLPAPIEEINAQIIASWEQLGILKKIMIQKETLLRLCNLQEMPLIGIDVIPTQQGPKLYINGEGAKFNRERYLAQSGRRLVSRQVEELTYEQVPHSVADRDRNQGRIYFKITTKIEDIEAKKKIVTAVASGTIPADKVKDVLEQLGVIQTYTTLSSYSNQSEKYDVNRQPDVILKKGITQCHRRADLEISSQCVIPEDEEPRDAEFIVRSSDVLDKAKEGATSPKAAATPGKVVEHPANEPQKSGAAASGPGSEGDADKEGLDEKIKKINETFSKLGFNKAQKVKFFTERGWPVKPSQLTNEIMGKALEAAEQLIKDQPKAAQAEADKPSTGTADTTKDPEKNKLLAKIFASREDSGFKEDDEVREWVKKRFGKGLSEMSVGEVGEVVELADRFSNFLSNFQKWGFSSKAELLNNVVDFAQKSLHEATLEEITKIEGDLNEMM